MHKECKEGPNDFDKLPNHLLEEKTLETKIIEQLEKDSTLQAIAGFEDKKKNNIEKTLR